MCVSTCKELMYKMFIYFSYHNNGTMVILFWYDVVDYLNRDVAIIFARFNLLAILGLDNISKTNPFWATMASLWYRTIILRWEFYEFLKGIFLVWQKLSDHMISCIARICNVISRWAHIIILILWLMMYSESWYKL